MLPVVVDGVVHMEDRKRVVKGVVTFAECDFMIGRYGCKMWRGEEGAFETMLCLCLLIIVNRGNRSHHLRCTVTDNST